MKNIILTPVLIVVAAFVVAAGAWFIYTKQVSFTPSQQPSLTEFSGAVVAMDNDRTHLTVKGVDGVERAVTVPSTIKVHASVAPGEIGKVLANMSAGDVIVVTTNPKDTSVARIIKFLPREIASATTTSFITTLLSTNGTSITIPEPMPVGVPATTNTRRLSITKDTKIFTEVDGPQQTGKLLSQVVPGTKVRLYLSADYSTVQMVEIPLQ